MDKAQIIRECFTCDFETGVVYAAERPRSHFTSDGFWERSLRDKAGRPVPTSIRAAGGHLKTNVGLPGEHYSFFIHRIVWTLANGAYPEFHLDHIDNDPTNNRLANLRPASQAENMRNAVRNRAGLKGAYRTGSKWFSAVWENGKHRYLGVFDTEAEAHQAWCRENKPVAGRFFNPGYSDIFS